MKPEEKKRCTLCLVVRYTALAIFILVVIYAFYVKWAEKQVKDKIARTIEATQEADRL